MSNKIQSPDGSKLVFGRKVLKAREISDLAEVQVAVQRAHEKARHMLAEARQIRASAYEKGYEEGIKAGSKESASRMIGLVAGSVDYLAQREREIAAVVVTTVERILGEMNQDEMILRAVRRSLSELRNQQSVTVRAAPANANTLLKGLPHGHPEIEVLNVVSDERLSDDECVIETDIGIVNINKSDFIHALKARLAERFGIPGDKLDQTIIGVSSQSQQTGGAGDESPAGAGQDASPSIDFSRLELEPLP